MNEERLAWVEDKKRRRRLKKDAPVFLGALLIAIGANFYMQYQDHLAKQPKHDQHKQKAPNPIIEQAAEFFGEVGKKTETKVVKPAVHSLTGMYSETAEMVGPAIEQTRKLFAEVLPQQEEKKPTVFIDSPLPQSKHVQSALPETLRL